MSGVSTAVENPLESTAKASKIEGLNQSHKIIVCAETSPMTAKIMPHAKVIAAALNAELTLVHVMEPRNSSSRPTDPFEWDLCRREAEAFVCTLSKEHAEDGDHAIPTKVMQGRASEQISTHLATRLGDIAALCRSDLQGPGRIGHTARRVLEAGQSSFLMVPASAELTGKRQYRRVMVPLDGSSRAEAAIWMAKKIALAQEAELLLVHAAPELFLIKTGPLDSTDLELKEHILRRNEQAARNYLQRLCEQMSQCPIAVRSVILAPGDVRRQLNDAVANECADLVVLSSHGDGGHVDACIGDVAVFLLANSPVPVLMMRQVQNNSNSRVHGSTKSRGVRRPAGAA